VSNFPGAAIPSVVDGSFKPVLEPVTAESRTTRISPARAARVRDIAQPFAPAHG
jgi:hypothetical protein